MSTDTTNAIVEYSPTSAALADIATRMAKVVYDVSTPKGMAAAKADRAEVRELRVALEKKRVEIKAPALKRAQEIDTEARRITAELLKFETPPDECIKREERRIEAERQAKIDAALARVAALHERIAELRGNRNLTPMNGSKLIAEHISDLVALPVDASFGDLLPQAEAAKAEGMTRLTALLETALANEKESARLVAERAELDRQRADQAERDRVSRETREAEEAAARKKRAEEVAAETERLRVARVAFEAEQADVAALGQMRMEEIMSMGHQVMIATGGRLGVRTGGTLECIVETLAETEAWTVTEEKFGPLTSMAMNARARACEQIAALLVQFDQRAENERIAAEQVAAQEAIDKANRELEARQQAEREAQAQREREAVEAEEARQHEEDRRQVEAALEERRKQEAAETERAKNFRPTFEQIVTVVALHFGKEEDTVRTWIAEPNAGRKAA